MLRHRAIHIFDVNIYSRTIYYLGYSHTTYLNIEEHESRWDTLIEHGGFNGIV